MNVDDRPYPAPAADSIELGEEILVYDGEQLHLLRAEATRIWKRADGQMSAAQISADCAGGVAGRAEDVHRDVIEFLDRLVEQCLLVTSDAGAGTGYRHPAFVGYVQDGDHVLLVDLRSGRRQALNGTGSLVWKLICQHGDPATVLQLVRAKYAEAPITLESEVTHLLEQLLAAGLLVPDQD